MGRSGSQPAGPRRARGALYSFDATTLRPGKIVPLLGPPIDFLSWDGWVLASTAKALERFKGETGDFAGAHAIEGGPLVHYAGVVWVLAKAWQQSAYPRLALQATQPLVPDARADAGWWSAGQGWAIARTGFRLAPGDGKAVKFSPFTAVDYDAAHKRLWLVTPTGWLERWDLPNWEKPGGRWKLGVTATALAVDSKRGVAWVGVIDPETVAKQPRAASYGDVWKMLLPK